MKSIKVILWDVYGTLVTSRVGDLQAMIARADELATAFEPVIEMFSLASGFSRLVPGQPAAHALRDLYIGSIASEHKRRHSEGAQFPEVRIEEIWRGILQRIAEADPNRPPSPTLDRAREVSLFFEQQANPRSLYPNVADTLLELRRRGVRIGIISNAQFYTHIQLNEMLREQSRGAIAGLSTVFDERLLLWSCDFGVAKPDPAMFRHAFEILQGDNVAADECMYVGNDMLHDVWLAREHGMAAVLFAGDSNSVRWRRDDPRCAELKPDAVIYDHKEVLSLE